VRRALATAVAAGLVGSGCWDFDGRYAAVTAELADAGTCHQALCLYSSYVGTDVLYRDFSYDTQFRLSAGVVGGALEDVVVYIAPGDEVADNAYTHALLHFVDGGLASRADVTQQMRAYARGVAALGTPSALWAISTYEAQRFLNFVPSTRVDSCNDTRFWGGYQRSASDVYFTGTNSVCHWTGGPDAGQVFPSDNFAETVYLNAAWVSPQGEVSVGGCAVDGGSWCFSRVFLLDGGVPAIPEDYDLEYYGVMAMSGAGDELWAASRTGVIFRRTAAGAYRPEHTASYGLFDLEAAATDDVWAVGDNGLSALHYDGVSWTEVALPPAVSTSTRWERVHLVPGGLVVAGALENPDAGGLVPVVRLYRRGH